MEGVDIVESKECYMAAYARDGLLSSDHIKCRTVSVSLAVDSIPDDHVAIQSLWISVDPYVRSRMTGVAEDGLNVTQFPINQVIKSYGVGKIVRSKSAKYKEDDLVICPELPVAEYSVLPSKAVTIKVDPAFGIDPVDYLSVLGIPGFAAWVGIVIIGKAKAGENVFISAAAGGVGMVAGQLAKIKGCRVIGSTGSDDKVKLLKEEFGYDEVINYKKEPDLDAALSKYFPNGIDIYFENVGGKTLEAVLNHVNTYARIPLCGMISQYNKVWTEREGVRNLLNMVGKEVLMQGFMMRTYFHMFGDFITEMVGYLKEKKLLASKVKINTGIKQVNRHFVQGPHDLAKCFRDSKSPTSAMARPLSAPIFCRSSGAFSLGPLNYVFNVDPLYCNLLDHFSPPAVPPSSGECIWNYWDLVKHL